VGGECASSCVTSADCSATGWCDAGVCKAKGQSGKGIPCTSNEECQVVCADGFCCNALCTGQCEACDVLNAEGSCVPIAGAPPPQSCSKRMRSRPARRTVFRNQV